MWKCLAWTPPWVILDDKTCNAALWILQLPLSLDVEIRIRGFYLYAKYLAMVMLP